MRRRVKCEAQSFRKGLEKMRELFEIDTKDYDINGTTVSRPSARGIIIRDGKVAMVHSKKYEYYKFPGGGIEFGEDKIVALVREVAEETGLCVIVDTIKEFGHVYRIQKGDYEDVFIQDNYYYLCDTEETVRKQKLDDYEKEEQFTLEFVTPEYAIEVNQRCDMEGADKIMTGREIRVLQILIAEGYFN